jgi:hypothetical protein
MIVKHSVPHEEEQMTTLKGGSSGLVSHGNLYQLNAGITAAELARIAGVTPADVHYWGKNGHLEKRKNVSSPYPLNQVPKAQLMGIFAKQLHMDATSAAGLAEQLLPLYAKHPDIVEGLRTLAEVVENRIEGLAHMLLETDLVPNLAKLLEKEKQEKEEP